MDRSTPVLDMVASAVSTGAKVVVAVEAIFSSFDIVSSVSVGG